MITRKSWFHQIEIKEDGTVYFYIKNVDGVFEENIVIADLCTRCFEVVEEIKAKKEKEVNGNFVLHIEFCKFPGAVFTQNLHDFCTFLPENAKVEAVYDNQPFSICEMRDMPYITPIEWLKKTNRQENGGYSKLIK